MHTVIILCNMDCNRLTFLEERIVAKKALLVKWEESLNANLDSGFVEYTLEDGQGRQSTKRTSVTTMRDAIRKLENEIFEMEVRAYGCGSSINRGV